MDPLMISPDSEIKPEPSGGKGGNLGHGPRAALVLLTKQVRAGDTLTDSQAQQNIKFAMAIRDSEQASPRDRLRAMELLEAMIARGVNVAMYVDKMDRIDSGQATENVSHAVIVRGIDPEEL